MKIHLRDILWLLLFIAVALGFWRDRIGRQTQLDTLANEVKYLRSAAPPIEYVDEDIEKFMAVVSAQHGIRIDMDWPSLEKVGYTRNSKMTKNLQDGSLRFALKVIFEGQADVVATPQGLLIVGKPLPKKG